MSAPTDPVEALIAKWRIHVCNFLNSAIALDTNPDALPGAAEGCRTCARLLAAKTDELEAALASRPKPQEDEHLPFRGLTDAQRMVLRRCFHADGSPKVVYCDRESASGNPGKTPYWCDVHRGFHTGAFRDGDVRKSQQNPQEHQCVDVDVFGYEGETISIHCSCKWKSTEQRHQDAINAFIEHLPREASPLCGYRYTVRPGYVSGPCNLTKEHEGDHEFTD